MGEHEGIAAQFVAARREARALSHYPGRAPETLADAYRIQSHAISLMDEDVVGWKVGRIGPPHDARHGINRLAGPIFRSTVIDPGAAAPSVPVFAGGFAAAEAEFLLRIGAAPDPAQRRFSADEAAALIDVVHVGIEIASSPFTGINGNGPAVTVSDFGNNYGLIVGAAVRDWRDGRYLAWPVTVAVDDVVVGEGRADAMLDGPIGAARFLFELMAERGVALSPGQWISSGAVTGVHPVTPGQRVEARFGDDCAVRCVIEAEVSRAD